MMVTKHFRTKKWNVVGWPPELSPNDHVFHLQKILHIWTLRLVLYIGRECMKRATLHQILIVTLKTADSH